MEIKWIHDDEEGMTLHRHRDCLWLSFPCYDGEEWVLNGFSTRFGGVSTGYFASMNLGHTVPDEPEHVRENYRRIAGAIGFQPEKLVCSAQTHTKNVRIVTEQDAGRGYTRDKGWNDVDGLITNVPGLTLSTVYADCVPLYFVDPRHHAIGLAHSGWRGTAQKIGREVLLRMSEAYGTDPGDVICAIGPSICQECYEVSSDVALQFPNCYSYENGNGKYQLDLADVNRGILVDAGVPVEQIHFSNLCTSCNSDLLFSHRASGGKRGLNAAFLSIR